jgi:triacylglycerol lipase
MSMESNGSRRSISTSSTEQDWGTWASGLWSGGSNRKHDESLAKDDQGDTVEEEEEKHRRKCEYSLGIPQKP